MCMIGTFSQYGVISQTSAVKVDDDLPLEKAVLVGCGVPTGWSAVNTANVAPGDTVAIYGVGGIGINAVQGARYAGAKNVVAIDPLENKREKAMELGATHAFATAEEAQAGDHRHDPGSGRRLGHPYRRPHDGRGRGGRVQRDRQGRHRRDNGAEQAGVTDRYPVRGRS